jgi:hypothetical protein
LRAAASIIAICLALAGALDASAGLRGHGKASTLPAGTVNFGIKTLAGYGGSAFGNIAGSLSIVSLSGGCVAGDFLVDGNGYVVPNNAAHTYTGISATHYGDAPPAFSSDCSIVLTNGTDTAADTIHFVSNAYSVRGMPSATYNADTTSSFQVGTLLAIASSDATSRNVHLGDTIYCRDSTLNPTAQARYIIKPPTGLYSGSGRINLVSETVNASTDGNGNPVRGGGCQMAEIDFDGTNTADTAIPIDMTSINFYSNYGGAVFTAAMVSSQNNAHGVGFYNNAFAWGPAVTNAVSVPLFSNNYTGADAAASTIFNNNHLKNGQFAQFTGNPIVPVVTAKGNVLEAMLEKGFDINMGPHDIESNLIFGGFATGSSHGDSIIFLASSYLGSNLPGPTVKYNIILHGDPTPSAINTVSFASISGTPPANGTYSMLPVSGGSGRFGYLDLTVSGGTYTAIQHAFSGGGSQGGGRGYAAGDVVSVVQGAATVSFNVSTVVGSPDQLPIFMASLGTDTFASMIVKNNLITAVDGDSIYLNNVSGAAVNYNTAVSDFQSWSGFTNGLIIATNGAGGSFDRNVTNTWSLTTQSGSPTCYPGTPGTTPSCSAATIGAYTLGAYQAYWPSYDVTTWFTPRGFNRAAAIAMFTPAANGNAKNADATYSGSLFPANDFGEVCWNDGSTWNHTAHCTAAQ